MDVGKKGGGKHWTAKEVAARQEAAAELGSAEPFDVEPPSWLSLAAIIIWDEVVDDAREINLLNKLDANFLAIYCDALAQYRKHSTKKRRTVADIGIQQAWARIIAQYADKLGFTPSSRTRLVKKKADEKLKDKFGDRFD